LCPPRDKGQQELAFSRKKTWLVLKTVLRITIDIQVFGLRFVDRNTNALLKVVVFAVVLKRV